MEEVKYHEGEKMMALHSTGRQQQQTSIAESEGEWVEVRMSGKLPERRSNHASFLYENLQAGVRYLYIHGGRDLREGAIDNMWRMDLDSLMRACEDSSYPAQWEQVNFRGSRSPGRISHHRIAVQGDKAILVGGLKGETSNTDFWLFDLKTNAWEIAKVSGDVPTAIDDHALSQVERQLIIFGGFAGGSRVNGVRSATFTLPNALAWTSVRGEERSGKTVPVARNALSAVANGNSLFAFGGQDEDNNKLGDLWEFNLATKQWAQIAFQDATNGADIARSGHASVVFNGKMYIFGGILEVTKELNDLLVYDFKTQRLSVLDQPSEPADISGFHKLDDSVVKPHEGQTSPMGRGKTIQISPTRKGHGGPHGGTSPNRKTGGASPHASSLGKSPAKKMAGTTGALNTSAQGSAEEKALSSPTSVSMQNSFIIKNADESFDLYYQQMKRRRHLTGFVHEAGSPNPGSPEARNTTFQRGRKPNARDGHSANVDKFGFMFVFGGDRHQMPFNDLFLIKLPK